MINPDSPDYFYFVAVTEMTQSVYHFQSSSCLSLVWGPMHEVERDVGSRQGGAD